jgi:hypothetical protein
MNDGVGSPNRVDEHENEADDEQCCANSAEERLLPHDRVLTPESKLLSRRQRSWAGIKRVPLMPHAVPDERTEESSESPADQRCAPLSQGSSLTAARHAGRRTLGRFLFCSAFSTPQRD